MLCLYLALLGQRCPVPIVIDADIGSNILNLLMVKGTLKIIYPARRGRFLPAAAPAQPGHAA
jgi:hypothetical protein